MTVYTFCRGFRLVEPYLYTIRRGAKKEWFGRRLDEVISENFRFLAPSMDRLQQVFDDDRVKVDGNLVGSEHRLSSNEMVELLVHMHEPEVLDRPINLLHIDNDVVVVDKPCSIPAHPVGRFRLNTVLRILGHERPDLEADGNFLSLVHRIDRQTSGLLVLARTPSAASTFTKQFVNRRVRKEYLARVKGVFPSGKLEVDQPVEQATNTPPYLFRVSANGRRAVTVFEREAVADDGSESIVRCTPVTGRTHQIRVHLQWLGHPITNDLKYGGCLEGSDDLYNHTVPKATSYQKISWCPECFASEDSIRDVPEEDTAYSIWLHSLNLTCKDLNNSWTFASPKPPWSDFT